MKQQSTQPDALHTHIFSISSVLSAIKCENFAFKFYLEDTHTFRYRSIQTVRSTFGSLRLHEQGLSILGTPIRSQHSSSGVNTPSSHCGRLPSSSLGKNCQFFWRNDLAKLNRKCHMSYSIIYFIS